MISRRNKCMILLGVFLMPIVVLSVHVVNAGDYLLSAHGNSSSGVNRESIETLGYSRGNCTHCHEAHSSIDGTEPAPGTPSSIGEFVLFDQNIDTSNYQTNGICYQCHSGSSLQRPSIPPDYSYSVRHGGLGAPLCPDTAQEMFSYVDDNGVSVANCGSSVGSAHILKNISSFINTKNGYTDRSNPCTACHNPHAAQTGWPVSLFSEHANSPWPIYGDQTPADRMPSNYQPPYANQGSTFEPDNDLDSTPTKTVDYVTFCTECHTAVDGTIWSDALSRNLLTINWGPGGEKHGDGNADGAISMDAPYDAVTGKVLNCTDCHEPHGSRNKVLIRERVNGGDVTALINAQIYANECVIPPASSDTNRNISYLCNRCHQDDSELDNANCSAEINRYYVIHHDPLSGDPPYAAPGTCSNCHISGSGTGCGSTMAPINCNCCHFHGSNTAGRVAF